jgi:hypothetical protein
MTRFILAAALFFPAGLAVAAAPPVESAQAASIARLRVPLHDIELHSRAILSKGHQPKGFLPFLRAYAVLRDHLDTQVSRGELHGAIVTAREDLADVRKLAADAGMHDFDEELARCQTVLDQAGLAEGKE